MKRYCKNLTLFQLFCLQHTERTSQRTQKLLWDHTACKLFKVLKITFQRPSVPWICTFYLEWKAPNLVMDMPHHQIQCHPLSYQLPNPRAVWRILASCNHLESHYSALKTYGNWLGKTSLPMQRPLQTPWHLKSLVENGVLYYCSSTKAQRIAYFV